MKLGVLIALLLSAALGWCNSLDDGGSSTEYGQEDFEDPEDIRDYPYMVAVLRSWSPLKNVLLCGGSILSENWVLSAAQCSQGLEAGQLLINAGSSQWNKRGSLHNVDAVYNHHDYQPLGADTPQANDIALFKVTPPFRFRNGIGKVKLPPQGSHTWKLGAVTGWGKADVAHALQTSHVLQGKTGKCQQVQGPVAYGMLCTPETNSRLPKPKCAGNVGSPVVADGVQVGMSSSSSERCEAGAATYLDVNHYRDWIHSNTGI